MFVGREEQLGRLKELLSQARASKDAKPGTALLVRGRRRVGKSRLAEEFVERAEVPHLFYAAVGRPVRDELRLFAEEVTRSNLPGADAFIDVELGSWDAALRLLASAVPEDGSVIVIDELPYLVAQDPGFEGSLQRAFDRELSRKRVLLVGIGSDLAMMEALNEYGRPFHQRAVEMVVPPLSPAEVGAMLGLKPAEAFDAYLITGGLPLICREWPRGRTTWKYLEQALTDPTSALLVSAERALAAEFPVESQARTVLSAIGSGERTFTMIGREAGVNQAALSRALKLLGAKRIAAADTPLSTRPSKETRYRVADPYLRFWLQFVGPGIERIERGLGRDVLHGVRKSWTSWRGRAVEPVVRDGLERLALSFAGEETPGIVGGYWTRTNDPEIDIVVADRAPIAKAIRAVGSIKWLESSPFDQHDLARLLLHREQLPGATLATPLLAVARSGCDVPGVHHVGPEDLIDAWS